MYLCVCVCKYVYHICAVPEEVRKGQLELE